MVDVGVTRKLAHAFPDSFINTNLEFIAHRLANEYIILADCENEFDVKCKVLEWFSRGAHKTCPYSGDFRNQAFKKFMLNGINDFLGTNFTKEDIELIYDRLGNRVNHALTVEFVNSGYDLSILKRGADIPQFFIT